MDKLEELKNSYLMYERTLEDVKKKRKSKKDKDGNLIYSEDSTKKTIDMIENMKKTIVDSYVQNGGNYEDLVKLSKSGKKNARKSLEEYLNSTRGKEFEENDSKIAEHTEKPSYSFEPIEDVAIINEEKNDRENELIEYMTYKEEELKKQEEKQFVEASNTDDIRYDNKPMYDYVNLPSRGLCYPHKMSKLRVASLTAYDENMILSPNLYKDGKFMDYLLKTKVLEDINVDDLLPGDKDAIIIWLRNDAYGNEYEFNVTDPMTNKEFKAVYDMSNLKYREFKLVPDENGCFEYVLPKSGDVIKFRFLTTGDIKWLVDKVESENNKIKMINLRQCMEDVKFLVDDNDKCEEKTKTKILNMVDSIYSDIIEKYDEKEDEEEFTHDLTDRLILQTVSINNIKDRKYINDYIMRMSIKDSSAYRKYINENTPGIDYNITINRPESLGGGSFNTFLQLDQFIFINY